MFSGIEKAKPIIMALCALSAAASLSSCSTAQNVLEEAYRGTKAFVKGTAKSLDPIKNTATEYGEIVDNDILKTKEELDNARFEDVANNRRQFVGIVKDMSRFILEKSAGDPEKNIKGKNIEYIIPDMEEEFMNSEAAQSYGGRKKDAVRVFVKSFKIMTHYFSNDASRAFFLAASRNSILCQTFPLIQEKDDALMRKKAVIDAAAMIGYKMDVSEEIMEKEMRLHIMVKGKRVLNYLRGKENE